jgi:hypothetical protein
LIVTRAVPGLFGVTTKDVAVGGLHDAHGRTLVVATTSQGTAKNIKGEAKRISKREQTKPFRVERRVAHAIRLAVINLDPLDRLLLLGVEVGQDLLLLRSDQFGVLEETSTFTRLGVELDLGLVVLGSTNIGEESQEIFLREKARELNSGNNVVHRHFTKANGVDDITQNFTLVLVGRLLVESLAFSSSPTKNTLDDFNFFNAQSIRLEKNGNGFAGQVLEFIGREDFRSILFNVLQTERGLTNKRMISISKANGGRTWRQEGSKKNHHKKNNKTGRKKKSLTSFKSLRPSSNLLHALSAVTSSSMKPTTAKRRLSTWKSRASLIKS